MSRHVFFPCVNDTSSFVTSDRVLVAGWWGLVRVGGGEDYGGGGGGGGAGVGLSGAPCPPVVSPP